MGESEFRGGAGDLGLLGWDWDWSFEVVTDQNHGHKQSGFDGVCKRSDFDGYKQFRVRSSHLGSQGNSAICIFYSCNFCAIMILQIPIVKAFLPWLSPISIGWW